VFPVDLLFRLRVSQHPDSARNTASDAPATVIRKWRYDWALVADGRDMPRPILREGAPFVAVRFVRG